MKSSDAARKRAYLLRAYGLVLVISLLICLAPAASFAAQPEIHIIKVSGSISPATASFINRNLKQASEQNAACCIIQLDTPGGLAESMRTIVMGILASDIPVVVYVSPGGARAASAGVMITMAADIAAMAPGTNIGAAHPVAMGGQEISETMGDKIANDMVAHAKSIAQKRNRNVEWVEKAIRESVSVTEIEALEQNIIDLVAKDMAELIEKLDGTEIPEKGVLKTKGLSQKIINETLRDKILKTISDPNIAYIFMMIGLAGLYFEFSNPGAIFPGVLGVISLVLAFYSFQTLPVNYAGIVLIILAGIMFVLETQIMSHGALSIGGVAALILGSLMLFDYKVSGVRVAWSVLVPTVFAVSTFFVVIAGMVFKSHMRKPKTGASGILGETGHVKNVLSETRGKVLVHAELWNARFAQEMEPGDFIKVTGVDGLVLKVEKTDEP